VLSADSKRVRIQLFDESTSGAGESRGELVLDSPRPTLREILRQRVRREVEAYNATLPDTFTGLVQPEESERLLNAFRPLSRRPLDWEAQYEQAIRGFETNAFLVLAGGRQLADLDEELDLADSERITFLKLVPLIGG